MRYPGWLEARRNAWARTFRGHVAEDQDLQEAVYELHEYLSDRISPLLVAGSLGMLLQYPAKLVASEIWAWTERQRLAAGDVPASDFLFHAVKKVSLMGEFEFISKEVLAQYLRRLGDAVMPYCPDAEKDLLRQNLERLANAAATAAATPVGIIHRQGGSDAAARPTRPAPASNLPPAVALGLRRLSLFLERLRPQSPAAAPAEQRTEVASQFMTAAAVQASTEKELAEHLESLHQLGIDTQPDKVFRALAGSLAGWGALPAPAGGEAPGIGGQLGAMRKIVTLAEDPAEGAKRFRELVHAAIEQFNAGHLGRAVVMFELAEQLVAEQKVKPVFVEPLRKGGHEYLDATRLRKLAERPDARASLRTILDFFLSLQPDGLLRDLNGEPNRDRRHELLGLLEVHGPPARAKALELLRASVEEGANPDPYFQMNLVYLLRVIPRPEDSTVEDEVGLVMQSTGRSSPPPLVKQVIGYLAATRHEKTERALITYLRVFESMLIQPDTAVYSQVDIEVLLDRVCAALARYGTPRAWRAMVDHGLKTELRLGSTMSRLAEAGRQDLSGSKDIVERLLAALKAELPRTVLGFTVKKNDERIACLIQALSGTPLPEVAAAMQEIADKHPGQRIAELATKALATLKAAGKPAEPPAGLSGDLDLFGLPGLLQTLGQTQLTGVLSLMNAQGKAEATLLLDRGKFRGAQFRTIRGEEAMYELFERPFPGTFAFVSRADVASQAAAAAAQELLGLILEGVRRYDEFKRSAAIVPDGVRLQVADHPSTPLPDEDEDFTKYVWTKAAAGTTVTECESSIATDSYRVRRLLAHWVEEGALAAAS
ncbi:MAG: hypothetical protein DMF80_17990 [Acidobacteria bacterium]|nr:MAG: hypothetical protein DMF80_17990 [Acidobacteriota bacterium]